MMIIRLSKFALGAALTLTSALMIPANADEWNKETILRFDAPVQVPGKVLAPGKYIFKLADDSANRNIVQIFSEDDTGKQTLVTTIQAIPDYRLKTPDKPEINFEERHTNSPEAIHSWFYPGDNYGWEFVYPKSERLEVAATPAPAPEPEPAPAPAAVPTPEPPPAPAVEAETVTREEVILAQAEPAPAPEVDTQGSADRELPKTSGNAGVPLLAGFTMLLAGGLTLFRSTRKARV